MMKSNKGIGSKKQVVAVKKATVSVGINMESDKLAELKKKVDSQKDIMSKSGKRFRTATSSTSTQPPQLISETQIKSKKELTMPKQGHRQSQVMEIGTHSKPIDIKQPEKKLAINLNELSLGSESTKMESSHVFQKELKDQKKRNEQIQRFLSRMGLQKYCQQFLELGYDEMETLVEIGVEELNLMRIRASQQDVLIKALQQYRQAHKIQQSRTQAGLINKPSTFKTVTKNERPLTSPISSSYYTITTPSKPTETNSSFFLNLGCKEWSLESQVRRACSGCFKLHDSTEMTKLGECYYCKRCNSDQVGVTLNQSMVRFYK